jgi:hypothetical protein
MVRTLFVAVLAAALLLAPAVRAETLTNDAVVELSQAGLAPNAIVAKIRASDSSFDVSTDALIALKHQNVADDVIAAMVNASGSGGAPASPADTSGSADPSLPHAAGLYLLETSPGPPRMQRLDPTVADESRASNALGWILTYGIVPLKVTTVMAGPTARFSATSRRPTFYFYFNQPGSGLYQNGLGMLRMTGPSPSPALFTLVHFDTVKGNRQVLMQEIGMSGTKTGGVDKARISFTSSPVAPGVFQVTPDADLDPGEYAFVYSPQDVSEGDDSTPRYFDFSAPGP